MPNAFVYIALAFAPLVIFYLFRRYPAPFAASVSATFGLMFLPHEEGFWLPLNPTIDKRAVMYVSIFAASMVYSRSRWRTMPRSNATRFLVAVLLVSSTVTPFLNGDPLHYGPVTIPGHHSLEFVRFILEDLYEIVLPFLVGRALFRSPQDLRTLLMVLAVGGVLYSFPIFVELRMSPQIHQWIYGYPPSSLSRAIRYGGYRPLLFMQSGIALGTFMAMTAMASATLGTARMAPFARVASIYLVAVVILCKSLAAILYCLTFVPLLLFWTRGIRAVLIVSTLMIVIFPIARFGGADPPDAVLEWAYSVNPERGESLEYRFDNENLAIDHFKERPLFGWGEWARCWVYDKQGKRRTVLDAHWAILIGERGIIGAAAIWGIMGFPLFLLLRRLRGGSRRQQVLVLGTGLIVAERMIDMLTNGFYTSLPIMISGAIVGALPALKASRQQAASTSSSVAVRADTRTAGLSETAPR